MAINWLTENFAGLFDVINHIVGGFIDGFQGILMWVPFYLMIAGIAALAWWKVSAFPIRWWNIFNIVVSPP